MISALANTSFTGITGNLSFSPDHRGREDGIAVHFKNNKGEAGPQVAGSWTAEGFEYPEGFTKEDIVWSTASGEMPMPTKPPLQPQDHTKIFISAGVFTFLLLVGAFFYQRHLKHAVMRIEVVELEMAGQGRRFSMQRRVLEEEVRLKKHSEDELKVMVAALLAVSKERQDELKEVMMDSKELKIDRLLGKGG
jgi:hypothetical protein